MLRESRTSSYRQVGAIEREGNHTTETSIFSLCLKRAIKRLSPSDEEGYKETRIGIFNSCPLDKNLYTFKFAIHEEILNCTIV